MDAKILEPLFGGRIGYSIDIYENVKREVSEKKNEYMYLSQEAFTQIGIVKGAAWTNSCFTYETLQRLFLACVTGHFRMYKGIEGIEQSLSINNYLVFCSTTRGFMEAASDFYYLEDIPAQLIDRFEEFRMAIAGKKDKSIIDLEQIEELLLHYQEASDANRKKGSSLCLSQQGSIWKVYV